VADPVKILFIVGPTAVGKSRVAAETAQKIRGEIITCDSMQVYRGLDICTDKPSPEERREVPHHLIDFVSVDDEFSVNAWREKALEFISGIAGRGCVPIIAGGTGLYYRSLVHGLFPGPAADWNLRQELTEQAQLDGADSLYQRLKEVDRPSADNISPNDIRRIIRALEIYYLSGHPKSELIAKTEGLSSEYQPITVGLEMPRPILYDRINQRVEEMWQSGLVDEIKELVKKKPSRSVLQIIGYKEVKGYLDGIYSVDEAKELMARSTRRLAKRQLGLFRQDKDIQWVQLSPEIFYSGSGLKTIVDDVISIYKGS